MGDFLSWNSEQSDASQTNCHERAERTYQFHSVEISLQETKPKRTFHIATVNDSLGEVVVQYFSGQADVLPDPCRSFYKMSDDDSELAKSCQLLGRENKIEKLGKWGFEKAADLLGSDQNETRLFNHAVFIGGQKRWVVGFKNRFECDDDNRSRKKMLRGDF